MFQITASPSARSRQLSRRTGNFFKTFLQFYVYDLIFKAAGLTTFLVEFWTLVAHARCPTCCAPFSSGWQYQCSYLSWAVLYAPEMLAGEKAEPPGLILGLRSANNMSWRTCVVVKQIQSNQHQPMRGSVTLYRRLTLAGRKPRISPGLIIYVTVYKYKTQVVILEWFANSYSFGEISQLPLIGYFK